MKLNHLSLVVLTLCASLSGCAGTLNRAETVAQQLSTVPTYEQTRSFLARTSLTPETACATGVSAEQVPALFQAAAETLDTLAPSFAANELAVTTARSTLAELRSNASSSLDSEIEPAIRQAEAALTTSLEARTLLWQTAFDSIVNGLTEPQRTLLATIRSNAKHNVATEYKVVTRTAEEWAALKAALLHIRSREACGLTADAAETTTVSTASTAIGVSVARQRLETLLGSVRAVWASPSPE
jgi:hypothetical protein